MGLEMWKTGGGNNQTGWSSTRYDELIDQAARLVTTQDRLRTLHDAEKILLDEMPVLPLYTYVNKGMLSRQVRGWHPNLLDQHPLKHLSLER